jgi:hypothetical protein
MKFIAMGFIAFGAGFLLSANGIGPDQFLWWACIGPVAIFNGFLAAIK